MNVPPVSAGGVRAARKRFETASVDLARSFVEEDAPPAERAVVKQIEAEIEFRADAVSLRVAADMIAALLEIQEERD